ncbi:MAG: hypothetical protein M3066_11690 [Actinomycetota bacterium]|nr:hypothetical protein [Actinomycetota bacterium]
MTGSAGWVRVSGAATGGSHTHSSNHSRNGLHEVGVADHHTDAVRPTLDPSLAELAAHRLEEVEQRLRSVEPAGGSSSSTTTS